MHPYFKYKNQIKRISNILATLRIHQKKAQKNLESILSIWSTRFD